MSRMTAEQVLDLIEKCAALGKQVDLSCKDLQGINLSKGGIEHEMLARHFHVPEASPVWVWRNKSTKEVLGVNLRGANLRCTKLQEACLQGANLENAVLVEADLRKADLTKANLKGANLCGSKLESHGVYAATLCGAIYDRQTIWPEGFNPEAAKAIPK